MRIRIKARRSQSKLAGTLAHDYVVALAAGIPRDQPNVQLLILYLSVYDLPINHNDGLSLNAHGGPVGVILRCGTLLRHNLLHFRSCH